MKKILLNTLTTVILGTTAIAQNVNIPDANFKAYLVANTAINTNSDSEIQVSEAAAFTGVIDCGYSNITDMTGLEAFTEITELRCYGNNLSTLDVSQNLELEELYCQDNLNIVSVITGANTNLQYINASMNTSLYQLDVSQNSSLVVLNLEDTGFNSLDVTANSSLETLLLTYTYISSLDLSQNTALTTLGLFGSYSLNVIDVSNCINLTSLNCTNINSLTELNLKNLNPSTLTSFYATGNPNLTCIEVDDVAAATANWTNIDATASFSLNCSLGVNESELNQSVSVYPNPTSGLIQLQMDSPQKVVGLSIVNMLGQKSEIELMENMSYQIDGEPGFYVVEVTFENGDQSKLRVIKN